MVLSDKLGFRSITADDRLIGPFNALLLHPEVTATLLEFQVTESRNTSLSPIEGSELRIYKQTLVSATEHVATR